MEATELKNTINTIPKGVPYVIEGNSNIEVYVGNRDCNYTFFDDANQCVVNIGMNTVNCYNRYKYPILAQMVPYGEIQRITALFDIKTLIEYLKTMGKSQDEINKVVEEMGPLLKSNMNPFENTNRTMTDKEYVELLENNKKL